MLNRKKLVAEHALALFVENGIANTSIQDIIKRSGISKGTFYNYFSSKAECIEVIIEQARYETALMRAELMIGKDEQDLNVLINQIGVLSQINRKLGLDVVFEELLHSGDQELKRIIIRQRLTEIEWFATRLVDIYGEDTRPYAFEAAIIFYGMTQNLLFISKMINQQSILPGTITKQTLTYLTPIIEQLKNNQTAVLDVEKLNAYRNFHSSKPQIPLDELKEKLCALKKEKLQHQQQQIIDAVIEEFQLKAPRLVVMNALLKEFMEQFKNHRLESEVKTISSYIWYTLKYK